MLGRIQSALGRAPADPTPTVDDRKFGWFAGVFTPTILTILGAIMYLREGWVVGNAGLLGALTIILLAHIITICTGLAVSSLATNTKVGAGGAFAIISQSLGLEIGGSVGLPLYVSQGFSVALYVLAFAEGFISMFPAVDAPSMWLVAPVTFALVFIVAYISAQFAVRIQFVIMVIIGISLVSIVLASFPIAGRPGFVYEPVLFGDYSEASFWGTFAIFFPAVTGIMAGISMSGVLRDPRKGIPLGTMSAIFLGLIVYVGLAYWLSRVATPEELLSNSTIIVDRAVWGWSILAGMLGATFSSALGSLVAAPRVMQALAVRKLLPYSATFARESADGEPRAAMLATGLIGLLTLLLAIPLGGLNAVAEILSLFFLITYGMLNVVVLIEQTLGMVSFRPVFRVPLIVPFLGMAGCVFVMFLVNPIFSLIAIVIVVGLYTVLARRTLESLKTDVRSGLFLSMAEWAAVRATQMPPATERTWRPTLLVPVRSTAGLVGSYRFLWALTNPQGGVSVLAVHPQGDDHKLKDLEVITQSFLDEGIFAQATRMEDDDFVGAVRNATQVLRRTFFRPNLLFLRLYRHSDLNELQTLIDRTAAYSMGIVLLARHPVIELGRERLINVWVTLQDAGWEGNLRQSNIDLSILMSYQLARNWRGTINLCTAVAPEREAEAHAFLSELSSLARLPRGTELHVFTQPFMDALGAAPRADLGIFGLSRQPDLEFVQRIVDRVDTSCAFVRDSGEESALA